MATIDLMDQFSHLGEGGIRNNGTLDAEVMFQSALRTMRTDFIQVKAGDSIVYKNMSGMSSIWNILSFYTGDAQGFYVSGIAGQTTPQSGVWTAAQDGYVRLFGSFPAGDNISVTMTDLAPDVEDYLSQYNAMNYRFLPNSIPKIVAHIQEYLSNHPIADSTTLQAVIDAAFQSYMEEIQETADTYIAEAVPPAAAAAVDAAASPALAEITAKADEAAESAREAALSQQSAEMSEENALTYRNQAQQIKDSISAEVAASVLAAQEQATLAQESAQAADESADTAEQFVAQARAQAEAAADQAQTASGYASDAQGYMQDASGFAQNASDFADNAAQSAATFSTDPTLTIAGKAADAKATGDQLSDLKSAMSEKIDSRAVPYGYEEYKNDPSIWGKGYIDSSTGTNGSPTSAIGRTRIRTKEYITDVDAIIRIDGGKYIRVLRYQLDGTYVDAIDNVSKYSDFNYSQYKYRFSVSRPTDASIEDGLALYVLLAGKSDLASETELNTVEKILSLDGNVPIPFTIADTGRCIRFSTGDTDANSSTNTTDYIDISLFSELFYKQIQSASTTTPTYGLAFYDSNKIYISGERCKPNADSFAYVSDLKQIKIPANAKYVRFTIIANTETHGNFEVYGKSKIQYRLDYYKSDYNKNVIFGSFSTDWYTGQGDSYEGFTINTLYAEIISAWDALVTESQGYVTREEIGESADGQPMYCYKLIPARYRNNTGASVTNNAPIIMIVPSLHGFEKSAAFGTYYFARDLVQNYNKNPVLNSLRTKCILYIIPVGNPYGFDNKTRKNYNGVDLNRNWGTYGGSTDPTSPYYMGAEPFDQPETQAIKSVIDASPNMLFLVDYHTDGQYKAASWATVNWMDAPHSILDDRYFRNAYIAAQFHFSEITENLIKEYSLTTNGETIGSITLGSAGSPGGSTIGWYARSQNIMGYTFEGNNGLPSEQADYSAMEQKINSELIGNWVKNLLLVFKDASLQMQSVL